ncbi:hypothetical protein AAF712_010941 [Marasmius tenuissimus]|uniref:Bacteriophage T5 Orf172 DNA-binding domain-containing protein n=1 Tax=Marasmius tenuissimus TaxID=585030 RepID=A0ABR2ZLK0_9AGAR
MNEFWLPQTTEHVYQSDLNVLGPTLDGFGPTPDGFDSMLDDYGPALNDFPLTLNPTDEHVHQSDLNVLGPTLDGFGPASGNFGPRLDNCPPTFNVGPTMINENTPTLYNHTGPVFNYSPPTFLNFYPSTLTGYSSTSNDCTPIMNPHPSTLKLHPPILNMHPSASNAYADPAYSLPTDYESGTQFPSYPSTSTAYAYPPHPSSTNSSHFLNGYYAYPSTINAIVDPYAYDQRLQLLPSTIGSISFNSGPDPQYAPVYYTRSSTSTSRQRPLFTYEPLDDVRRRSSVVAMDKVQPSPRQSDARPWEWVDPSMVGIVERVLGITLRGISLPKFEVEGSIYCYRIHTDVKDPDTGLFKVGRTGDVKRRETEWRRQCHSQNQEWFDEVKVQHCHLTGKLYCLADKLHR